MESIQQTVEKIEKKVAEFTAKVNPETADAVIGESVAKFRAKFDAEGLSGVINTAPTRVLQDYEEQARGQYDEQLRTEAQRLQPEIDAALASMETMKTALGKLPDPVGKSWNETALSGLA